MIAIVAFTNWQPSTIAIKLSLLAKHIPAAMKRTVVSMPTSVPMLRTPAKRSATHLRTLVFNVCRTPTVTMVNLTPMIAVQTIAVFMCSIPLHAMMEISVRLETNINLACAQVPRFLARHWTSATALERAIHRPAFVRIQPSRQAGRVTSPD